MHKKRIFGVVLTLCVVMNIFSACKSNSDKSLKDSREEQKIVLNERQIELLKQFELPTEYSELNISQKNAIVSIEDMLVYMENKYEDTFEYSGYWPEGADGDERMEAECSLGTVTVYRYYKNGEYSYEDDYEELAYIPVYEEALDKWIYEMLGSNDFKLFSFDIEIIDKEDVLHGTSVCSYIFIEESVDEDKYKEVIEKYGNMMKQNNKGCASSTSFYRVKEDVLNEIYRFNCIDKIYDSVCGNVTECSISTSGELNMYYGEE